MRTIKCAAIRAKTSDMKWCEIPAKRHADCYEILHKTYPSYDRESVVEGFLTNDNHFVDRYEAKKIAVAANQLIVPIEWTVAALYSEDIY